MTVSTTTASKTYAGDGATTAFPVPFVFYEDSDLQVIERVVATGAETTKTLTTHYTVTGGDGSTGTVTAVTPPAATVQWVIRRVLPRTQAADLVDAGALPADTIERMSDRLVMLIQEVEEVLGRALRFPVSDSSSLSAELPSSVARASKHAIYDSDGNPGVGDPPAGTTTVSTYGATLIVAATALAARTLLEAADEAITLTAGSGLTGGGTLEANRSFAVGAGTGIVVNADDVAIDAADKAAMEAETANKVVVADLLKNHPGVAKVWGLVSVSGGTPTLEKSYNVTSITDTATGRLTVTIATDFSDTEYAVLAMAGAATTAAKNVIETSADRTAGVFVLESDNTGGALSDPTFYHFACFGDQ